MERFYQAVVTLIQWLSGFGQPVVLLLDDWGRAGDRAAEIYARLLSDGRLHRLTILATERDNEPFALAQTDNALRLELAALSEDAALALAKELLGAADDVVAAKALCLMGESRTPLDISYAIRTLQTGAGLRCDDGVLSYDAAAAAALLGESAIAVAIAQAQEASAESAAVLCAMAVYGEAIGVQDLPAIAGVAGDVDVALRALERIGLVAERDGMVALGHDRVRDHVLGRESSATVRRVAAEIAEALRHRRVQQASGGARQDVMLRRRLEAGLEDVDAAAWATLFSEGAEAKRRVGALDASASFAEAAITLAERAGIVSAEIWREGVYAALARKEHVLALERSARMGAAAPTPPVLAEARELRVVAARMADDADQAIAVARAALQDVGLRVPVRVTWFDVIAAAARVVTVRVAAEVTPLDAGELAVLGPTLRAMNAVAPVLFERDVRLAVAFGAGAITPRVARGTAAGASICAFVCSMLGLHRRAARWAELSDQLQGPGQPLRSTSMHYATRFGHWYVRSRAEMRDRTETGLALAYAEGDLSLVAQANRNRVYDALLGDETLSHVAALADDALDVATRFDDRTNAPIIRALRQLTAALIEGGDTAWQLRGEYLREEHRAEMEKETLGDTRRTLAVLEQTLCLAFGAYESAAARAARLKPVFDRARSLTQHRTWTFLSGLAARRAGEAPDWIGIRLLRQSARLNPRDNMHRILLLDAERARADGRAMRATMLYGRALEWAGRSGCALEHGIVAEAAGEGAALMGQDSAAMRFRAEARGVWRAMGAHAVLRLRHGEVTARDAVVMAEERPRGREAELELARDLAERANAAKSRFVAAVGHELATPLQGLQGLLDVADATKAPDLDAMRGAVAQLTALVRDLTDLGAMDSGALVLRSAPFDPVALTHALAAQMAPMAHAHGRLLRVVGDAPIGMVLGDEIRVRQVLSNLILNALKHGAGDIELSVSGAAADGGRCVRFSVLDHGAGLQAADVALIFEPFRRGPGGGEGHGLGLSIARRLAVAMGGALAADVGEGATVFRLTLTLAAADPTQAEARGAPMRRVLIAEDDLLTRRTLARMLRAEGCAVDEACDGADALAQARVGAYDLVLLDVGLPKLSGDAVAREMRAGGSAHPIALMSAAPIADAPELGLAACLRKPIARADLLKALGLAHGAPHIPAGAVDADDAEAHVEHAVLEIIAAHEAGDSDTVACVAHRLAGLAALVSAHDLLAAARRLEDSARAGGDVAAGIAALKRVASVAVA